MLRPPAPASARPVSSMVVSRGAAGFIARFAAWYRRRRTIAILGELEREQRLDIGLAVAPERQDEERRS